MVLGFQSLKASDVVINEIMYRAPDDLTELEYVELWNSGNTTVDVSGWRVKGIGLEIASGTSLDPGGFFVACRNAELFEKIYENKPDAVFTKSLNNGGERLTLINANGAELETVKYDDKAPWPESANGKSASLERVSPMHEADLSHNWAPSNLTLFFAESPSGTPGNINSAYQKDLSLFLNQVVQIPPISEAGTNLDTALQVQGEVKSAEVLVTIIRPGQPSSDFSIPMNHGGDDLYHASIPGQASDCIVRYRYQVTGIDGTTGWLPHPNALRPTFSSYVPGNLPDAGIPIMHFISASDSVSANFENYRTQSGRRFGRGGFGLVPPPVESKDDILRRDLFQRSSDERLKNEFAHLTLGKDFTANQLLELSNAFRSANKVLEDLRVEISDATDLSAMQERFDAQLQQMMTALTTSCRLLLTGDQIKSLSESMLNSDGENNRRRGFDPKRLVHAIFDLETMWFQRCILEERTEIQIKTLDEIFSKALAKREQILLDLIKQETEPDLPSILSEVRNASMSLNEKVRGVLGETEPRERASRGERQESRGRGERFRGGSGRGFGGFGWWRDGDVISRSLIGNPSFFQKYKSRIKSLLESKFKPEVYEPIFKDLKTKLTPEVRFRAQLNKMNPNEEVQRFHELFDTLNDHLELRREFLRSKLAE